MTPPNRQLVISPVPMRKGKWLVVERATSFYAVAKFRDDAAVEEFEAWLRESDGRVLRFVGDGE